MKFFRRGVSTATFVPTIADTSAPTQAEVTAGTPLSKAVATIDGWDFANSRISQPVLAYKFSPQIDGEQTAGDASMTLLEDDGTTDVDSSALAAAYTALTDGASGFMVLAPVGTASGKKVEVWPIKVLGNNRVWSTDNAMAQYKVDFAVTNPPVKNATMGA